MNPMNSNVEAISPGMPQNEVSPRKMRTFNKFPMSYDHKLTCRYGDITPFFVFDSWSEDKVPFASFHDLRNYTMSEVFQERLKMYKDYFLVPMKAILPRAWDFYIANPNQGDDIPDNAAPYISNQALIGLFQQYKYFADSDYIERICSASSVSKYFEFFIKYSMVLENVFSDGGLFSYMGCKLSKYITYEYADEYKLDTYFERFYSHILDMFRTYDLTVRIPSTGKIYRLDLNIPIINDSARVSYHKLLEVMRDNSDWEFAFLSDEIFNEYKERFITGVNALALRSTDIRLLTINISRIAAYQISCAHFMSQDNVDSIYSADLYRSLLETDYLADNDLPTYEMNGVTHLYDVFSSRYLEWAFMATYYNIEADELVHRLSCKLHYLYHLTTFRKSLKFGNYFTGSRVKPLAVGDVNAPVVNNSVSAIDITKNIAMQRFLNAVNKTGRKISEYSKKILGGYVQPVSTDPKYLARDSITIGSQEVENTSNTDTGHIVTNLRSEQSKFAFECEVSEPSIILGLVSFECRPTYSRTIDRHFLHKDRFDLFNSYFQNIGDQEVFRCEKGLGSAKTPFGYQLRHMEYKQRFSIASGGYVDYLPAWSFIVDNNSGSELSETNLSSDFIRSSNADFDRFYTSLTGNTLSSYFHFNIWFINSCEPLRNMEYSPTIL